jgi:predicted RNA-binding Zn-ribbon protein involved in translation (DUF1610 family)
LNKNTIKLVKRKCPKCGGKVVKYSPTGNFKTGFWYECKGCGYPIGMCTCETVKDRRVD